MGRGRNQRRAQNYRGERGNQQGNNNQNSTGTGLDNSLETTNNTAIQKLNYDYIVRGIGYKEGGTPKRIGGSDDREDSDRISIDDGSINEEMTETVANQLDEARRKDSSIRLGDMTRSRPDGVFRLMAGNVNNMSNKNIRHRKVGEIQQLIDHFDIQAVGISEVGIDFRKAGYNNGMSSWFRANRENYKTSSAHNTRDPAISISQPGGIGLIACKELKQYVQDSREDFRKLGRWNSWIFGLNQEHRTRMVVGYQVAATTNKNAHNTIFLQHRRYCQHKGINQSPRELFQNDFIECVTSWLAKGERLVIFMDFNEHALTGKLPKQLQQLGLTEVSHMRWGAVEPNTYARGTRPIDGVYISQDLEVTSMMILPFSESIGDHRTMIVDIDTRSAVGEQQYKIIRPDGRRLVSTNRKAANKYRKYVENAFKVNKLHSKLSSLERDFEKGRSPFLHRKRANAIDHTKTTIMLKGEKQCRKRTSLYNLPFSPEIQRICNLSQAYRNLARWIEGRTKNSRIIEAAWNAGIKNPRQLSTTKCTAGIAACRRKMRNLYKNANNSRREHLRERYLQADRKGDVTKKNAIQQILANEQSKLDWKRIKFAIGNTMAGAVTKVQKIVNGEVVDITGGEDMNREIQEASRSRFTLAHEASIQRSSIAKKVGACSETSYALRLLTKDEDIPLDVGEATISLIEEMSGLWEKMNEKHTVPLITKYEFKGHWTRVKENTSSSLSGIHMGHWKTFLQSPILMEFECRVLTLIARSGIPPERWSKGLQVMLEKTKGVCLIDKLRFILLMEGDKNAYNRMFIGYKAIRDLEEIHYIPEDQYSQRGSTAEDSKLDNRLTLDFARQMIINMTAISADADKCYDRINHIVLALALRAVCGDPNIAKAMLESIQHMKFYQRTGRGDSNSFLSSLEVLLQGICQGNTAGPACWIILSSIMIRCYEKAGHGSKIISPISGLIINFMGEIFVDDTDLLNILSEIINIEVLMEVTQGNLDEWTRLLMGTGGALNPTKCYWYLISFINKNGVWEYDESKKYNLTIQLPSGERQVIEQLPTSESRKMLGVWSNPRGIDDKHINEIILGKMTAFVTRTKNGHLPTHLVWKAYRSCLIPALKYGLGTLATPMRTTKGILTKCEFELLSYLGVNNKVRVEWRTIPRELGGVGLWNFTIEQCTAWMEAILQHYGTGSTISKKMIASLEALQLEIGSRNNPLLEDYKLRGSLATECWMKAVWERINSYKIQLILTYKAIPFPRERDQEIVHMICQYEKSKQGRLSLNRVRLKLQVIFLSCITSFCGTYINQESLLPTTDDIQTSTYKFPRQQPTALDWTRWKNFWYKVYPPNLYLPLPLGKWVAPSHKVWKWVLNPVGDILYCQTLLHVEYYTRIAYSTTRAGGTYARVGRTDRLPLGGVPVNVQSVGPGNFDGVRAQTGGWKFPVLPSTNKSFWQALDDQGGSWMWKNMTGNIDDMTWLATALTKGTVLLAADGSFNVNKSTLISGAGWMICCSSTGKKIQGSAYEKSTGASSYRGEMLGLLALYAITATAHSFYKLEKTSGKIIGDNQGALSQAHKSRKRVTPSEKQTDVIRAIRSAKYLCPDVKFVKHWVKSHVDDHNAWTELSIEEQLNTLCDDLAKAAVQEGVEDTRLTSTRLLPYEAAAIVINDVKIADGMAKELRHQIVLEEARSLYTKAIVKNDRGVNVGGLGWDTSVFNSVDWKARSRVKQSEMRSLWLCKQEIGISRTRRNNARITRTTDSKCPNCERHNEDSKHLNICTDAGRTKLHRDGATKLRRWMSKGRQKTEPTLTTVLYNYIRLRSTVRMEVLATGGSRELVEAAKWQDRIGWLEIMHGKLAIQLVHIQERYSASHNKGLDGKRWATNIVTQLLEMSHAQWLYRNFSLHHITAGYLRRQEEKNLRETARELASLDPNNLPAGSQYLLEIDIESTEQTFSSVSYWVLAMKAAQKEKIFQQKRNRQQRRRDEMYGRNWTPTTTLQAAISTGKRDHSSMVAAPKRQQLKRTKEGARSNTKRWTQQTITSNNNDKSNNTSQRWKNTINRRVVIHEYNETNRPSKRQRQTMN